MVRAARARVVQPCLDIDGPLCALFRPFPPFSRPSPPFSCPVPALSPPVPAHSPPFPTRSPPFSRTLQAYAVDHLFDTVVTNPAYADANGRLRIVRHTPPDQPHQCPRCPPNLCKGLRCAALIIACRSSHPQLIRARSCVCVQTSWRLTGRQGTGRAACGAAARLPAAPVHRRLAQRHLPDPPLHRVRYTKTATPARGGASADDVHTVQR